MSTHGGQRTGAGRPVGGVSQARRLISQAIEKGLATAGRKRFPNAVDATDQEAAAVQTGAMIVDDMIQSGQGGDVMKLWAAVSMKDNDAEKSTAKHSLAEALARLPAQDYVTDVTKLGKIRPEPAENEGGTTQQEREAPPNHPYFAPQIGLTFDDGDDAQECGHPTPEPAARQA